MKEVWLRNNTRALSFGLVLPAVLLAFGLVLAVGIGQEHPRLWVQILGGLLAAGGLFAVVQLIGQLRQPRLAYRDGQMLVYLSLAEPVAVPIDVVEGFLLGQGPSFLPGRRYRGTETATIVIRLAEAAQDWAQVDGIKPALGKWCGGYITIRGTWCEPLSLDLVNRLNRRLAEVQAEFQSHKVLP